jgi:hypothetical protein
MRAMVGFAVVLLGVGGLALMSAWWRPGRQRAHSFCTPHGAHTALAEQREEHIDRFAERQPIDFQLIRAQPGTKAVGQGQIALKGSPRAES